MNAMSQSHPVEREASGLELATLVKTIRKGRGGRVDIRTRKGRHFMQNAMYLLATLDHEIARTYSYEEHFNGPYSRDLNDDLKGISSTDLRTAVLDDQILSKYPQLAEALHRGERFVHALALVLAIRSINSLAGKGEIQEVVEEVSPCLLYTSPSPRDGLLSRMPSSA